MRDWKGLVVVIAEGGVSADKNLTIECLYDPKVWTWVDPHRLSG